MLMTVGDFCDQVESNMAALVDSLVKTTNRRSDNEILSWQRSLPKLSVALSQPGLQDFHISLGQSGGISLEYKLPAASAWCDAVLLGRGDTAPSAVMIELKDWDTRGVRSTPRENLIDHHGDWLSHPSDQVRGYVEYCQNFHSTVLSRDASVAGCVFFTSASDVSVYRQHPYENLVSQYPVFSSRQQEMQTSFPDFLAQHLRKPDYSFAKEFETGTYAQSRSLMEQVANLIQDDGKTIFVLLDEQRRGYELCLAEIDQILKDAQPDEKAVIIIEGPPGSGKSVLAAKLWAALAKDQRIAGNVVLTSTSSAQNSNWGALFQKQSHTRASKGIVIRSNSYSPGFPSRWVQEKRDQGHAIDMMGWKKTLRLFHEENHIGRGMKDNAIEVSIVDEAHALIDPSVPNRGGVKNAGWTMAAGPQAYHIMRCSRISIFLMDSEQSYRDNETTTKENLISWATDHGVRQVQEISLGNAQFRCGGSKEYVSWLEHSLNLSSQKPEHDHWRRTKKNALGSYTFEIVNDPMEIDEQLTRHWQSGKSVRLGASYSREWVTKDKQRPHDLPPHEMDFHIPFQRAGRKLAWSKIWNYVPNSDYSHFIQATPGSRMYDDPLSEVGCPYVLRGFDYDYLGVVWLDDLYWDKTNERWMVNLDKVYETAWHLTLSRARHEPRNGKVGPETETVIKQLQRGYRILLSRAVHGVYIWFENPDTRDHVQSLLK